MAKAWIIAIIVLVIAGLAIVGYRITGRFVTADDKQYDNFAKCLSQNNVIMFGSKLCPHCNNQKNLFGDSFQYITYVECTEDYNLCQQEGVTGVPAWLINGKLYTGEKTIKELSELSGCPI